MKLLDRLKHSSQNDISDASNDNDIIEISNDVDSMVQEEPTTLTLKQLMQNAIEQDLAINITQTPPVSTNLSRAVRREMTQFEDDNIRVYNLKFRVGSNSPKKVFQIQNIKYS